MDLLVVGGSGLLGREIVRQAQRTGRQVAATFHRQVAAAAGVNWRRLDIRRRDEVAALVHQLRPAAIINAAYRQDDWVTTADGGMHVAAAAAANGAHLVQVSSDAVFSGTAECYDETGSPDPISPYGAAKAAVETATKGLDPSAVIARTSLIVGTGGSSRQERMVHALAADPTSGVLFTDDLRCPIDVTDLASALLELASSDYSGIHHVAGADAVSRYELGRLIARRDGLDDAVLPAGRRADTTVPGPIRVRLDCAETQAKLTTQLRGARVFLDLPPRNRWR
ncbi:SDR family oxidoreductase [Salinispora fenicalii]|uniref:SDR family oxidoreductase n=1 Tax=Salinispora fenicalii TaxID=1137263 RepID=UPI000489DC63|nr:sugar nucleotide-binding protein [Salinispora fenicalii]